MQRVIFDKPEGGARKIVLATNMAETSITINDVVYVVDCGKAKETSYDALNNTPCLLPSWISKASARQLFGLLMYSLVQKGGTRWFQNGEGVAVLIAHSSANYYGTYMKVQMETEKGSRPRMLCIPKGKVGEGWAAIAHGLKTSLKTWTGKEILKKTTKEEIVLYPFCQGRAIFFAQLREEAKEVSKMGVAGEDGRKVMLHPWTPYVNCFVEKILKKDSLYPVFGVPFHLWTREVFNLIGECCGGLIEVYPNSLTFQDLLAIRLKVASSGGNHLPRRIPILNSRHIVTVVVEIDNNDGGLTITTKVVIERMSEVAERPRGTTHVKHKKNDKGNGEKEEWKVMCGERGKGKNVRLEEGNELWNTGEGDGRDLEEIARCGKGGSSVVMSIEERVEAATGKDV
ncbi:hypothetical protein GIB67_020692 [Kingdonia uniflora]|uniref:DUF4283 domain-containing protein n=1 Tax=Kingdonia uniflora TaxID=39325 RepID=A0A7J7NJP3_9MAGN|nr:hypothetical protein GIB67_020692 [Kingdonia uniflora]